MQHSQREHDDSSRLWDNEYGAAGIPSSWKHEPSTTVLWGLENLKYVEPSAIPNSDSTVLESGCGTGRNAIAVAAQFGCHVRGFDYSKAAIDAANARLASSSRDVQDRVQFSRADVRDGFPFPNTEADLAMDIFVYFHLLRSSERAAWRAEIARVLKPGGALLLSLADATDGYYSSCSVSTEHQDEKIAVVNDRVAGMGNIMHTAETLEQEMSDQFSMGALWRKASDGPMHGEVFRRVTLATLWTLK